ncbi:MAG: hypothetical protein ACM3MG_03235 [Bacillota bacterium]
MRHFAWAFLVAIFLTHQTVPALAAEGNPMAPTRVTMGRLDSFAYWFAKKLVVDVDVALKAQGIQAKYCTFRSAGRVADFTAEGLGPCLYKDFMKSMTTDQLAGVVYGWIADRHGRYHPIELRWRPPRGGWSNLINQLVEMRLETQLYSFRNFIWGEKTAERVRYNEFLGGDLKIILPDDPDALAVLAGHGGAWAKNYLATLSSIDVHLAPTANEKGKVVYDGSLILNHDAAADGSAVEPTKVALRTNVNVVILKRPFYLQAQIGSTDQSKKTFPVLDSGARP